MTWPEGYDECGEYVGPCPDCGTDHGYAAGPETVGGKMACIKAQAEALGDVELSDRISITMDWMVFAQANRLGLPLDDIDPQELWTQDD